MKSSRGAAESGNGWDTWGGELQGPFFLQLLPQEPAGGVGEGKDLHAETGPPRLPAGVGVRQGVGTLRPPKETGSDSRGVCAPLLVQPPCHHPLLLTDSLWLPVALTPTRPLLQRFVTCPHPLRPLCRAPSSSWPCQAPPSPAPPPGLRGAARVTPFSLLSAITVKGPAPRPSPLSLLSLQLPPLYLQGPWCSLWSWSLGSRE